MGFWKSLFGLEDENKEAKRLADGEFTIRELETQNRIMDKTLSKQKMFSKYFFEDAKATAVQYEDLSRYEDLFNKYMGNYYFRSVDDIAQKLNEKMADVQMIDDFSIRQLFDSSNPSAKSFQFLKEFIRFKENLNKMRYKKQEFIDKSKAEEEARLKKEEEEKAKSLKIEEEKKAIEKRKKEEEERLRQISNKEIDAEIYRIEHDLTADGSRFVNILDFQKKVARANGLLNSESEVQNDKLVYKIATSIETLQIIKNANKSGVNYMIFPDCQENANGGFMIAVSESDKSIFSVKEENSPYNWLIYSWTSDVVFGNYPVFILQKLREKLHYTNIDIEKFLKSRKLDNSLLYSLQLGYNRFDGAHQNIKI